MRKLDWCSVGRALHSRGSRFITASPYKIQHFGPALGEYRPLDRYSPNAGPALGGFEVEAASCNRNFLWLPARHPQTDLQRDINRGHGSS